MSGQRQEPMGSSLVSTVGNPVEFSDDFLRKVPLGQSNWLKNQDIKNQMDCPSHYKTPGLNCAENTSEASLTSDN